MDNRIRVWLGPESLLRLVYTNGDREPSFGSAGLVTWNVATFLVINGSDMVDIYGKMVDQPTFTMEMVFSVLGIFQS